MRTTSGKFFVGAGVRERRHPGLYKFHHACHSLFAGDGAASNQCRGAHQSTCRASLSRMFAVDPIEWRSRDHHALRHFWHPQFAAERRRRGKGRQPRMRIHSGPELPSALDGAVTSTKGSNKRIRRARATANRHSGRLK